MSSDSSYPTKIYPEYQWADAEIIGEGKWTCACAQPNFFETISIYDKVVCSLCAKEYALSYRVYLRPINEESIDD